MTEVVKIFDWPAAMCFVRADVGYTHAQVSGTGYFGGQPQGQILGLPKRMIVDASGRQEQRGLIEVMRYALQPSHLVRLADPEWSVGRSKLVASLSFGAVWADGAEWSNGATSGPYIGLKSAYGEGADSIVLTNLPANEDVVRAGDTIGIDGHHYMAKLAASSNANGEATVRLVRPLIAAVAKGQVEYPVRHVFRASIPMPVDRAPVRAFDWTATMVEVFPEDDYDTNEVTFENASFVK